MTRLGEVSIYIPKDAKVFGVILVDANGKPLGASRIKPVNPADGDAIDVTFLYIPDSEHK